MRIKIECLEGTRKGDLFTLKETTIIGRKAELALRDRRSSSEHAKIYSGSDGLPVIEDLGSSNGTRVNHKPIDQPVALNVGDIIHIGDSILKVLEIEGQEDRAPASYENLEPWEAYLLGRLDSVGGAPRKGFETTTLKVFDRKLRLEVVEGVCFGEVMEFGFGPRFISALGGDWVIQDPTLRQEDLWVDCDEKGEVLLKAPPSSKTTLNGQPLKKQTLKSGDLIQIGNTKLKVSFVES